MMQSEDRKPPKLGARGGSLVKHKVDGKRNGFLQMHQKSVVVSSSRFESQQTEDLDEDEPCECDQCLLNAPEEDTTPSNGIKSEVKNPRRLWRNVRHISLDWSLFKKSSSWVQLAGHQGNFTPGKRGVVLKKLDPAEQACFCRLAGDNRLEGYYPRNFGEVEQEGVAYLQLQDLLADFVTPSIMDCKMGVRTFLEEELRSARKSEKFRTDLYEKMVSTDPNEPTEAEHSQRGITKARYMMWRDATSTSLNLGFRIDGMKKSFGTGSAPKWKKAKNRKDVMGAWNYFAANEIIMSKYADRLKALRTELETSAFFSAHEAIGSSLLFVHDSTGKANVWMIDFAKTSPFPNSAHTDHRATWTEENHEDGYLLGVDNMISIWEELLESLPREM